MNAHKIMQWIVLAAISCICAFDVAYALPEPPYGKKWVAVENLTDEFDSWNSTKWKKSLWNYGVPVQMRAANSGVTGGNLWIKATLDAGAERWFETSRVMSHEQIRYPMYTECSMRTAHISAYNTFWLNNGDSNNRDEFDICENNSKPSYASQTERPYTMYSQYFIVTNGSVERAHGNFDNRNLSAGNPLRGVKWNEAYHTLGAWWIDENNIQFYLDGEPAGSVTTTRDFTRYQNIIWDLWTIDAEWSGGIADQDDLLDDSINTMYVDWIHTYELVDDPDTPPPVIASMQLDGSNMVMQVTNGMPLGVFDLLSSTNLLDPAESWIISQTGLQFNVDGWAMVTNPIGTDLEFYRTGDSVPVAPSGITFTAPDYSNGPLDGQQAWNAESGWTVADADGAGNAATADNSSAAVLNEPVQLSAGQTYSLSLNFQYTGGPYATPTDWVYTFLGGLKDSSAGASVGIANTAADANIQIFANADTYRLLNAWSTIPGASDITGTQLNAGDILQFDYELTLGANAAGTSYTVRLQNLTDGTDTGTGTVSGVDQSIYDALTGSGAYGFFQTIIPGDHGSGLTGVQVNSVTVSMP